MAINVDHSFNDQWPSFWGDKTSTLDWCEENYLYSQYVAEFWNATSNFFFMFIAFKGGLDAYRAQIPSRFIMLYAWVFVVGLGSLLFHATLKYSMQLLDEIPMIFMACQILHCIVYPNTKKDQAKAPWWVKSSLPLHAVAIAVSASYVIIGNPIFHQICFGAILVACFLQYPNFRDRNLSGLPDEKVIRYKNLRMLIRAVVLMIGAFGIWNVDNVCCGYLRWMRGSLTGPFVAFSPLLQLHAWWHVLTVAAADYTVAGIIFTWCQGQRKRLKSKLTYKLWGCFPLVVMEPRVPRRDKKE